MSADTPSTVDDLSEAELALIHLTEALQSAPSPQEAADILHQVLNTDTGLLVRVQEVIQAAAECVRDLEPVQGQARFAAVYDSLDEVSTELFEFAVEAGGRALPAQVRALARPSASSADRARAARLRSPASTALLRREPAGPAAQPAPGNDATESRKSGRA
ncbi:hypothetical protein ABH940_005580 [Streptacidiphilus sp. BW17]|uniref:hypothetical protein n=1 Tax=Streptacidiphilus sp. BW17 TaxID=3156274 RepID=UPI00351802FC